MEIALDYIKAGFVLVSIPAGSKGPNTAGWNRREYCITTAEQAQRLNNRNIGLAQLYFEPAPLCALDIDDFHKAAVGLEAHGVDLSTLLAAENAVQIVSGRPNRAKLVYRLPHGLKTVQPADSGIELRCGSEGGLTV